MRRSGVRLMAWRDKNGVRWLGRRTNGWPNDGKAPDGYTVDGYRLIDRQGRIRFGGTYWTHERLRANPGRVVRVCWGGMPGHWADERACAYFGHEDATPETLREHHSSFYSSGNFVYCDPCGDWNKRPVTKF